MVEKEPAVSIHLALWYVALVCHQYDVCKNYVGSVYYGGYGGLSVLSCPRCPVVQCVRHRGDIW